MQGTPIRTTGFDHPGSTTRLAHIASDPTTPAGLLDEIARTPAGDGGHDPRPDTTGLLRGVVASNPSADASTLTWLSEDFAEFAVLEGVLQNPSTPAHVLQRFALAGDGVHLGWIAENPGLGDQVLLDLIAAHPLAIDLPLRVLRNTSLSDAAFEFVAAAIPDLCEELVAELRAERALRRGTTPQVGPPSRTTK